MIVVIDYNVGNVRSVCNAFSHIGCEVKLSCKSEDINAADGLVLPGVAAFGYAISALGPLAEQAKESAFDGKPLLGICVGYQILFETGTEHGEHEGLGLIRGSIIPIPLGKTVPHIGWNSVKIPEDMELLANLGKQKNFYFAHSYYADITDGDTRVAYTDYGFAMPASVQKANIYGTQFHPEKSGQAGLRILKNFARICKRNTGKC